VRSKLAVTPDILSEADDLRVVARAGAGVDNIDLNGLAARQIALVNAPEGNRDAVGEFTVGLLLDLFRNISKSNDEIRRQEWLREANRGEEISEKTIAILGYGNMGKAFARRLSGFGCQVIAHDTAGRRVFDKYARKASLEEVFELADVVSFHIPLTPKNFRMANEAFFAKFRKPVWVLNTARGEIMDYPALVNGLKAGAIKGAALDVLENEKLNTLNAAQQEIFRFLAESPQVILTPHIAGWSHQSYIKINMILVEKIQKALFQAGSIL
ncbi:MAG TPA: NAD(P)-dependent oxidoreductase, partial [Adhaeribacter sp.]|nr:NAD(P)-dependent oxidoreductase [Adhaeribacter sp.]